MVTEHKESQENTSITIGKNKFNSLSRLFINKGLPKLFYNSYLVNKHGKRIPYRKPTSEAQNV